MAECIRLRQRLSSVLSTITVRDYPTDYLSMLASRYFIMLSSVRLVMCQVPVLSLKRLLLLVTLMPKVNTVQP